MRTTTRALVGLGIGEILWMVMVSASASAARIETNVEASRACTVNVQLLHNDRVIASDQIKLRLEGNVYSAHVAWSVPGYGTFAARAIPGGPFVREATVTKPMAVPAWKAQVARVRLDKLVLGLHERTGKPGNEVDARTVTLSAPSRDPVTPGTTISFTVGTVCHVSLVLYDVGGRAVRTLFDGTAMGGKTEILVENGRALTAGVYLCRLNAVGQSLSRRLIVL